MSLNQTEAMLSGDLQPTAVNVEPAQVAHVTDAAGVVALIEDSADRWAHWTAYMSMQIPGRVGIATLPGERDPYGPPQPS